MHQVSQDGSRVLPARDGKDKGRDTPEHLECFVRTPGKNLLAKIAIQDPKNGREKKPLLVTQKLTVGIMSVIMGSGLIGESA